ncbi:unnamed protein product [Nezara viridula]|uniref:Zinc finger PHD-type domain-containing protein n=1 Tax=Nezara viridula TaxID=85310 RepID=A0A9P0MR35_NEZVI|nr:unnamed protein product [Nezara viridula]
MVLCPICKQTIARQEKKSIACTITTCQAIFHGKCLNADESEFEALRALRKNWVSPKCEKARKNIQPTDKCLSPPRLAPQQQTVDSTSQLLLAAIKNLTEEVKGLKFSLDANANEVYARLRFDKHLQKVSTRAVQVINELARIMPNIGGPSAVICPHKSPASLLAIGLHGERFKLSSRSSLAVSHSRS